MWFDTLTKVWGRKIILLFIFMGVLPLSAFGAGGADFDDSLIVDFNDLKLFTDYWLYDYNDNRQCASWDLAINSQIDFYDLDVFANLWLTEYDFGDFSGFGRYWRKTVDYRFEDTRFDLNSDDFVDLKDFSSIAAEWMSTKSCCDNNNFAFDPNYFKNWQWVNFTNITNSCTIDWCIYFGDQESDPCNDNCGNKVTKACEETPDMGYTCDYNYYHNGWRVGLCVYNCGQNGFWILKNKTGCRILATMHFVCDTPPQDPGAIRGDVTKLVMKELQIIIIGSL